MKIAKKKKASCEIVHISLLSLESNQGGVYKIGKDQLLSQSPENWLSAAIPLFFSRRRGTYSRHSVDGVATPFETHHNTIMYNDDSIVCNICKTMNGELFEQVRTLHLPLGKYALFGSAPLGIRNLRECNDVDVIITDDVWNEYKQKEGWAEKQAPHGDMSLCYGDIELWKGWYPGEWNIAELIQTAEMISGLPFVTLENVVQWKKLKGREKDMSDLEFIENFLHHTPSTSS